MYYHCSTATWDIVYAVIAWSNVFVLKISALWLSFQIRKVKIKGLNESKYVVAIVYISSIFVIINFILSLTIQMYFTILQVLYGTLDIVNITTIISISFVPKVSSNTLMNFVGLNGGRASNFYYDFLSTHFLSGIQWWHSL